MPSPPKFPHWQLVVVSLLAGLGLGYLLGLALIRRRRGPNRALPPSLPAPPQPSSNSDLTASINELKHEVELLRLSVERRFVQLEVADGAHWNLPPSHAFTDGTSEFVSAQCDDEDATERLLDVEDDEEEAIAQSDEDTQKQLNLQRLDELGQHSFDDKSAGFTLMEEVNKQLVESPEDPQLLWRKAKALVHLSGLHEDDKEKELDFIDQAVEAAKKSVELDDGVWQCHYWYALAIGYQVRYQSIQKKIVGGYEYKDHLDTAVRLKPDEPMLHHYLGRWFYEVAGVSWLERKAAAALFAKPPEATYDEAMEAFMKVEDLKPEAFITNMLMVAKCHLKLGDQMSAVEWLEKADKHRPMNREDKESYKEVEDLLSQLSPDTCI